MPGVRSALDIAQWDLVARRADAPLHELIAPRRAGVTPERLRAYASLPTLASPGAYADDVQRYLAEGYTAFRLHAWGNEERDLEAIRAARDVAGDGVALIYDAEGCFDRPTAGRMMPALGDLGVRWFEAPLPDLDLEGYRRLMRLGDVAIVPAGDAIWDERLMTDILRDPPWSAMRFDVTFAGGITSAIRLFAVAAANDLPVELTSYGQTLVQSANLHVMIAFGRTSFFERAVPSAEFDGMTPPPRPLPRQIRSGSTPQRSTAKKVPVRPQPVLTSSAHSSQSCSSHSSASAGKNGRRRRDDAARSEHRLDDDPATSAGSIAWNSR